MRTTILACLLFVAGTAGPTGAAEAPPRDELREKIGKLAATIRQVVKNQPVLVGQFTETGLPDSNFGAIVELLLKEELRKLAENAVSDKADFQIKGDYKQNRKENPKVVRIEYRITDLQNDQVLKDATVQLEGTDTIARAIGYTGTVPKAEDLEKQGKSQREQQKERQAEMQRQADKPAVHTAGTLIASNPNSPYRVEILVRSLNDYRNNVPAKPRPAKADLKDKEGFAFVPIESDELYEVRIHNRSGKKVAVALSIDGLDVFHFSKERHEADPACPAYTHHIIDEQFDIPGWFKSVEGKENYVSFLVTAYGKGAVSEAAGLPPRGRVGVIHLQFSDCTPLPEGRPKGASNETGFGPPREVGVKKLRYEVAPPHDFVTIRYQK
jgi:hypothetical protein